MKNDDKEYVQIKFITYILLVLTILPIGGALITEVFAQEDNNYIVYDYEQMEEMERIEEEFILAKEEADQEKADEADEIIETKERKKELEKIRQEEKMKELEEKRAEEQKRIDEELERQREEERRLEEERQRQEEQARIEEEERQKEEQQVQYSNVSYGSASDAFYQIASEKGLSESEINGWSSIINRESGWSVYAQNPYSGAYGLGQALPGSKMASYGSDWQSNPYTQLSWMYDYMVGRYGSIQGAVDFWNANHWY